MTYWELLDPKGYEHLLGILFKVSRYEPTKMRGGMKHTRRPPDLMRVHVHMVRPKICWGRFPEGRIGAIEALWIGIHSRQVRSSLFNGRGIRDLSLPVKIDRTRAIDKVAPWSGIVIRQRNSDIRGVVRIL